MSHRYQVFVLASFGAHWHILVGRRRPHVDNSDTCGENWHFFEPNHHAGEEGMSDTLYVSKFVCSLLQPATDSPLRFSSEYGVVGLSTK
jgi:hypothetical protein